MIELIELLQPQNVFRGKKRLGPLEDGGYVMSDFIFQECVALFTYGIGRDSRFEEEFGLTYNKPAYMFDHTIREPDVVVENRENQKYHWGQDEKRWEKANCHFYPHGLGFGVNCKDFNEDYKELGIDGYVLLKIDIEGGEYDYFNRADISNFGETVMGIAVEVHSVRSRKEELVKILTKLNNDFILCHIHGNNWGPTWGFNGLTIPDTLELSFINRKFVDKYERDEVEYPIRGLDVPNNPDAADYKLTFLGNAKPKKDPIKVTLAIGDMVDRYTICKLKSERTEIDNTMETQRLWENIETYQDVEPYIERLYTLHGKIWELESDIRKGNEETLGLEEVGRRAILLRDMNKIRIGIKNEINTKYGEGYLEIKLNHGSELEPSVIISLTTVPQRLMENFENGIISTIKSLCEQEDDDYEVHFNIPLIYNITQEPYIIPEWLTKFQLKYSHLRVFRTEDLGPPTKFVPTVNRTTNPETILLVVDDDLVYHHEMVKEHRKYQELLKDSVICYEGMGCLKPLYGDKRDSFILCVSEVREPDMFQHYKSASYKRKLFNQNLFDYYLGRTLSDDALLSKYFKDQGVKIHVVPYEKDLHLFETYELWEKNHGVTTFPVLRHTASNAHNSGCNHPGLLSLPNGARFYNPPNLGKKD